MTPFDEIKTILDRIAASGVHTETDRTALLSALRVDGKGNVVVQIGKYNVHIEQGQDIRIGDHITYQGPDAEAIRQTIRQMLDEYRLRPGIPFQSPPLPEHFVPRPEVTAALKVRLLTDRSATSPGILVVSAIHGLGGIGKSTLAAALAYDPEVQRRFKDGILWATLGQQPDLLSLLSNWVQALGDYNFRPTTIEATSTHLRTLLQDKAALLVVDDVWQPEHALPFRVGGEQGQVLITTRRADVADEVGAELHQMDVMTPEQALDLLASRLRRPLDEPQQEEALQLARVVGYLPLALELAAARVARGTSWTALQQALEAEVARLEVLESPRRRRSGLKLEASFNLSLNTLRTEDEKTWESFVWLGVLPEDVRISAPMAATLWEMERAEAENVLELLWNDALLLPAPSILIGDQEWPAFRLHDLLHYITRRLLTRVSPDGLGLEMPEAHAALLERYKRHTQDGLWYTLPNDGYIHAQLIWHMEQTGQTEQIHSLLREETSEGENGWYQVRERLGQTAGFLADVSLAWKLVDKEFASTRDQASRSLVIGLQCRYALIAALLNSLARNLSSELLVMLVRENVWAAIQGLAYARQIPDPGGRVWILATLAPHLPESLKDKALLEALAAAYELPKAEAQDNMRENRRNAALEWLAPQLAEAGYPQEALMAVRAREGEGVSQEHSLVKLVPYLPEPWKGKTLAEALAIVRAIESNERRASSLMWLAPLLPEPFKGDALIEAKEVARAIKWDWVLWDDPLDRLLDLELLTTSEMLAGIRAIESDERRARKLMQLASRLTEPQKEEILRETLVTVQMIEDEYERAKVLGELISRIPESLKEDALSAALEMEDADNQVPALAALATRLDELGYYLEALATARTITNPGIRVQTLTNLVPKLTEQLKGEVLQDALITVRDTGNLNDQVLKDLIFQLADFGHLEDALAIARTIEDKRRRAEILTDLTPWLVELSRLEALEDVLIAIRAIERVDDQARVVAELASRRAKLGYSHKALLAVQEIKDEHVRARVLARLVPDMPDSMKEQLLAEVWAIEDANNRVPALVELVSWLAGLGYPQEALVLARSVEDRQSRAQALIDLVPHLGEPLKAESLQNALIAAKDINSSEARAKALMNLAPYLQEPQRREALQEALIAAREIEFNYSQAEWLEKSMIPELIKLGYPEEALAAARSFKSGQKQGVALINLIPHLHLPESMKVKIIQEALAAVRVIEDTDYQAQVLAELAPYLAEPFRIKSAAIANQVKDNTSKVETLIKLSSHLPEPLHLETLHDALATAKMINSELDRAKVLINLASHLPQPLKQEAFQEILVVVQEIRSKYSSGHDILTELPLRFAELGYFEEALRVMPTLYYSWDQARVLAKSVPYMPNELLRGVLALAKAIKRNDDKVRALVGLTPNLPDQLKEDALQEILAIKDEWDRAQALVEFAPHVPESLRDEFLREALMSLWMVKIVGSKDRKATALISLAPHLSDPLREEALRDALLAVQAVEWEMKRAETLSSLVPHLSGDLLQEALSTAREIKGEQSRVRALIGIVPHISGSLKEEILHETLAATTAIKWEDDRAKALLDIIPLLPQTLLLEALGIAHTIQWKYDRVEVLIDMARYLPEPLNTEVIREVMAMVKGEEILLRHATQLATLGYSKEVLEAVQAIENAWSRAYSLTKLTPNLPKSLKRKALREALTAIKKIKNSWSQMKIIIELAPHLTEEMLQKLLILAETIRRPEDRVRALMGLVPYLPASKKQKIQQEALAIARHIEWEDNRVRTLLEVASGLSEPLRGAALTEALETAQTIKNQPHRMTLLEELIPRIAELGYPQKALIATKDLENDGVRAGILENLAPHLPESLLPEALAMIAEIKNDWARAKALAALSLRLPETLLPQALKEAWKIEGWDRSQPLAALAPCLAKYGYQEDAMAAAQAIRGEKERAKVFLELAPYLPELLKEKILRKALAAAKNVDRTEERAKVLVEVALYLPESLKEEALRKALAATRKIGPTKGGGMDDLVKILIDLAVYLPESLKGVALRKALAVARGDEWDASRAEILVKVIPRLAELGYPQEALQAMREMPETGNMGRDARPDTLTKLAPCLPQNMLQEALAIAQTLPEKHWAESGTPRAAALAGIAPYLPKLQKKEALQYILNMARTIGGKYWWAEALVELVPHLPEAQRAEVLHEAIEAARSIKLEEDRSYILMKLSHRLSELGYIREALIAAVELPGHAEWETDRTQTLAKLVPYLTTLPLPILCQLWMEKYKHTNFLQTLALSPRPSLLSYLRVLTPVIAELGGSEAIEETFHAVQDVGRWWP